MSKLISFIISLVFLTTANLSEQGTKTITGKITDSSDGLPLSGVLITEKGTQNSTLSRFDGTYTITVADDAKKLVFSMPGMISQEMKIGNTNVINVALSPEIVYLEAEEVAEDRSVFAAFPMARSKQAVGMGGVTSSGDGYTNIPFNTESYDKIDENTFKLVLENPVSTFSVDVDRASYANMRRFLNDNSLPPVDAVRIEELINYFDYDYAQPTDEHPFAVHLEMGKCPWNEEHHLVSIGLQGEEIEVENLPPSNLVFLIDVSGSMGWDSNKLPLLKSAFKILIQELRPEDRVAMVVYAGAAGVVLQSTPGDQKQTIIGALDCLEAGGSTAGGEGIKLAYDIAKQNFIRGGNNRVILATDGDFNVGESSDAAMERLIEDRRDEGVFLTVLGFGMGNYKDSKMEKLSNAGNGNYAYIDNILEAKKVLGKEMWGTLYTIAKDVKIQIEFNPAHVKAYRLVGYENRMLNREDFNDDTKDAGDIGSGHTVTALYEIIPADSDEQVTGSDPLEYQNVTLNKSPDLMTLKLRYKKPDEDTSKLIVHKIRERDIKEDDLSDNFTFAAAVAEFGMLLRDSEFKAKSSYDHVIAAAKKARGKDEDGYRIEFIRLAETASLIDNRVASR
ncbi:MAG: von Willebrand factor type A domain-containing protein [Bacteroidales bacterium]|nr:von Willebrand factor type A domain-containing protein [Bacteroidales bacterium]